MKERLKEIVILAFLAFLFSIGKGQNRNALKLIIQDFKILDRTFHDNIFLQSADDIDSLIIDSIEIDTLILGVKNNPSGLPIKALIVSLRLQPSAIVNIRSRSHAEEFSSQMLNYVIIQYDRTYFRLFGFYSTDIQLLMHELPGLDIGEFSESLVEAGVLIETQKKFFSRALDRRFRVYPEKLGKPCEILKYYFNREDLSRASTIILPLEPMVEIEAH
jgi:hypothetical protein